jgi:arylformamidase
VIYDLSHVIKPGIPVYPGTPEVTFDRTVAMGAWHCTGMLLSTHAGTHLDAPSHQTPPGGPNIDEIPLDRFMGKGVVYHVTTVDDDCAILPEHLEPPLPELKSAVPFAILRTGWDRYWGDDRYYRNPDISPELAQKLLDCGFTMVGFDFINADAISEPDGESHRILMGSGVVLAENLTNLDRLQAGKEYNFSFLPLRIEAGDGAPIRAVAWD